MRWAEEVWDKSIWSTEASRLWVACFRLRGTVHSVFISSCCTEGKSSDVSTKQFLELHSETVLQHSAKTAEGSWGLVFLKKKKKQQIKHKMAPYSSLIQSVLKPREPRLIWKDFIDALFKPKSSVKLLNWQPALIWRGWTSLMECQRCTFWMSGFLGTWITSDEFYGIISCRYTDGWCVSVSPVGGCLCRSLPLAACFVLERLLRPRRRSHTDPAPQGRSRPGPGVSKR